MYWRVICSWIDRRQFTMATARHLEILRKSLQKRLKQFRPILKMKEKPKGKRGSWNSCVLGKWQQCGLHLLTWWEQGNCIKFCSLPYFLSTLSVIWHKQYRHCEQRLLSHMKGGIVKFTLSRKESDRFFQKRQQNWKILEGTVLWNWVGNITVALCFDITVAMTLT